MTPKEDIVRREAKRLGFDTCGITKATLPDHIGGYLDEALSLGHHGTMEWLENRSDERSQPQNLWEGARSIVMLGMNYGPSDNPLQRLQRRDIGNISVYAQGDDYHDVVKKRLKQLGRLLGETFDCSLKVFVDTAPVAEKPLGQQAGMGWQGKHTNLVSREHGSWLFLGAIYLGIDLDADTPEEDHCGNCRACLDVCPTDAFPAPYKLDARRCISYLTIEHKGSFPEEFRRAMGNRIYGCDDCLAVCPWNKFASEAQETAFHAREELQNPPLSELASLDDGAFRALFRKSPIKRIGRDRFVRNVAIAIGNSGDPSLARFLIPLLTDEDPYVQEAAAWAKDELSHPK